MQEKHLFEYAVIRYVPHVEREEFLNVGVILYSSEEKFLHCKFAIDEARLDGFTRQPDVHELKKRLQAFEKICCGSEGGGPIGKLPVSSRFRWLTAKRSTIIQISAVHPGLCINAGDMLDKLFDQLVTQKPLD